ncbi:hypothetical protein [Pseudomonas sp. AKS31]|uniref:hypothetical protein n=1 Tax=Pseudomonas sp. AKS31 TaxID=2949091 RepID=UPI00202A1677|nr:hypothetical protein [Pseudomonas sp. AKS31]MCL9802366.1 hypothetical protein [Pseudomonas sp. AKS31]
MTDSPNSTASPYRYHEQNLSEDHLLAKDRHVDIPHAPLESLRPVLLSWINCVQRYIDVWDADDLPYWYNEQANVSILAGAAWKADWTAIEEYQVRKIANEGTEPYSSIGRNDLYIANENHGWSIEAKVSYVPIDNRERARTQINEKCTWAIRDANRVHYDEPRLGAVFVAPYSAGEPANVTQIQMFRKMLLEIPCAAIAWVAPGRAQKTHSHDGRYYPMVALILLSSD